MHNIMYTMIVKKGETFEQSHLEIPDVWQNRPKDWATIFCNVEADTIVLLIPTTQVNELVSLLSQYTASQ